MLLSVMFGGCCLGVYRQFTQNYPPRKVICKTYNLYFVHIYIRPHCISTKFIHNIKYYKQSQLTFIFQNSITKFGMLNAYGRMSMVRG